VPSDFDIESGAEGPLPPKFDPDVEQRSKGAVTGKKPAQATAEVSEDVQEDQEPSKTAAFNEEHALEVAALAKLPTELGAVEIPPKMTTADRQSSSEAPTIRRSISSTTKPAKQQLLREKASVRRESPRKPTPAKRQLPDAQECNVRPSRRKISPSRLGDEFDEKMQSPKPEKSPSVRKTQPIRANWSARYLLENAKSKLATVDLAVSVKYVYYRHPPADLPLETLISRTRLDRIVARTTTSTCNHASRYLPPSTTRRSTITKCAKGVRQEQQLLSS